MTVGIPVLDVGGTHATAAIVRPDGTIAGQVRRDLDAGGSAEELLSVLADAAAAMNAGVDAVWGVAMPDPFDYPSGVGRFTGVGKFEALNGVDVGAALVARVPAAGFRFVNDADAFALGEWTLTPVRRLVGLTLGTGVGSGWIVDGHPVASGPGVPPDGRAHRLTVDGTPLEDVMSRRAIRAAWAAARPGDEADVRAIADLARSGDDAARDVLATALNALGRAVGPGIVTFAPDVAVVGGSMAASWDLFAPWFLAGAPTPFPPVRASTAGEHAALLGAARFVISSG